MKQISKLIYKFFSYLIILIILLLLIRNLSINWQNVRTYQFSFNYFYLGLSCITLGLAMSNLVFAWNKILRTIEPSHKISNFNALKIYVYSWFGKYIPGKIWTVLGKVYLGNKEGVSKKSLLISSFLDGSFSIISALVLGVSFLFISLGNIFPSLYLLSVLVVIFGIIIIHPKVFYPLFNFVLRKFKKEEISPQEFLSYRKIIQIIPYYLLVFFINGLALFCLINSIAYLSVQNLLGIIGAFNLAGVLGIMAVFAPSGLGIREGALVMFLQLYFPTSIAILISFLARSWTTGVEMFLFIGVYLYSKIKKYERKISRVY